MSKRLQSSALLTMWLMAPGVVAADPVKGLATCAAEANGVKRLACFDELAKRSGAVGAPVPVKAKGAWRMQESINKIDDSKTVMAQLAADTAITGWPGKTYVPKLIVRCQKNRTEVYIDNGMSPTVEYGTDYSTITVRFGKDKAKKLSTEKSTDGAGLFLPNPVSFLKEAEKHSTLLYEFVPFNSNSAMTTFNLTGIDEVIKAVRSTCKW